MEESKHLICPITLHPIKRAGITILGNVYDADALTKWLQKNSTDPLTNLQMPPELFKIVESSDPDVILAAAATYRGSLNPFRRVGWNKHISIATHSLLSSLIPNTITPEFQVYRAKLRSRFLTTKCDWMSSETPEPDRPPNTGIGYQFADLSNHGFIHDVDVKSFPFDFADLSNSRFVNCKFSRASFIGADLTNTKFIGCEFKGEQVCFTNAKVSKLTMFAGCAIEKVDSWTMVTAPEAVVQTISDRGLDVSEHIVVY